MAKLLGVSCARYWALFSLLCLSGSVAVTSAATANPAASIAQIASAGGWNTSLTLVDLTVTPAEAVVSFFDESGNPLNLPFTFPQGGMAPMTEATIHGNINGHGLLLIDTNGPSSQAATVGWSLLQSTIKVGGYALFTNTKTNWQAAVPLESLNASSYLLAFDNTGLLSTGVAIANLAPQVANINVIIRDDGGNTIGTETVNVPAQGHTSFTLTSNYPVTTNIRGTVEFDTPAGGQINVLGLRANGPALTTLPVLANVGVTGGSMPHVTYNQGWQTTFTLVNTGTSATQATLNFYDDSGSSLPISVTFPQTGAVSTSSTVTQTIAAGASLIVQTDHFDQYKAVTGWAQLVTTGNISGFAIFRYDPSQQEAVVPLETRNANMYTLAYDNTGGVGTGMALANDSGQSLTLGLVIRDDSGAEIHGGQLILPPHGHSAVVLSQAYPSTAGIRGSVQIQSLSGGQFSALGIRVTSDQNITTIPVLEN